MAIDLTALTQAVTDRTTVDDSMLALMPGLISMIAALKTPKTDPATQAAIDALTAKLTAGTPDIVAAVSAGTAAENETPAE